MIMKKQKNSAEVKIVVVKCDHCARKVSISEENIRTPFYCC